MQCKHYQNTTERALASEAFVASKIHYSNILRVKLK